MANMSPNDMSSEEFDERLERGREVRLDVRLKRQPFVVAIRQGVTSSASGQSQRSGWQVISEERATQNA